MVMSPSPRDMVGAVVLVAQGERPPFCPVGLPAAGLSPRGMCVLVTALPHVDCFSSSAGFSFDLSPLTKQEGYRVETGKYDFYINVCAAVTVGACPPGSGACQVAKR